MTDRTPDPGSPTEQVDWDALARYLAGESSAEEAEAMRRWLAARPDRAELVAALDRSTRRLEYQPPTDLDVEGALRSVRARLEQPDVRVLPSRPPRPLNRLAPERSRWSGPGLLRAAAVVTVVAGGTLLWQSTRGGRDNHDSLGADAQTFVTAVGERDSVRLPDGTRVVLGPGSRLAVDQGYGRTHREVGLRGEAYFDVTHDTTHLFTVRAGPALVRDVGTAFAVHSDPGDGVRVVVTSGAVLLKAGQSPADSGVLLRQGDRGVLTPGGRVVAERGAATEEDLAWTRGRLVFRDAPLAQVSADLRRWYGVEVRAGDSSLSDKHVTTTFENEPPQRVLEVIALILGADIQQHGDTAVLRARSSSGQRR